ncbi:MAG: Ni/Fe-hydrogenase, b-type cytochrome subunit [Burkholderiales bacterium]|jgi:Ni/Fe-hydrogenase 1 B-type cytochrome subunit|nr:Ni/Fe-hydrogenase, b-type cytochrome subunit [Burkholderiales bacterium]
MKVEKYSTRVTEGPLENVYVYEAPVRLWHWITVLMMIPLAITGYLIGDPPSLTGAGEATFNYSFAWVRIIHFSCAMIFAVAFLMRIYWAIVGNRHAHSLFMPPAWRLEWWKGLFRQLAYYLFLKKESDSWIGHNPLAQAGMFAMFVLGAVAIIITGFALYAQQWASGESWMLMFGWVYGLFGEPQAVRTVHHLAMYYLLMFAVLHIYMAFREDIMGKETVISTMVNGIRAFKSKEH